MCSVDSLCKKHAGKRTKRHIHVCAHDEMIPTISVLNQSRRLTTHKTDSHSRISAPETLTQWGRMWQPLPLLPENACTQLLPRDSFLAKAKAFAETHHVFSAMSLLVLLSIMAIGIFSFSGATWPFHLIDLIVLVCALSSVSGALDVGHELFPFVFW